MPTIKRTTGSHEVHKAKTDEVKEQKPAAEKHVGKATPSKSQQVLNRSDFSAGAATATSAATAVRNPIVTDTVQNNVTVVSTADRLLGKIGSLFGGGDRELDALSEKVTKLKQQVLSDDNLSQAELSQVRSALVQAEKDYKTAAAKRGFPVGESRPTTPEAFKVYQEQQQIHFEFLAGKDLKGGVLGELQKAVAGGDQKKIDALAGKVAADLVMSSSPAIAKDKIGMLRATLSQLDDRATQLAVLEAVRGKLPAEVAKAGASSPVTVVSFDSAAKFSTAVSVHKTELPPEIKGTGKIFPNKPIPGWEAQNRAAVKAGFDDMEKNGTLFISKIPPGQTAKVAMKLDLNTGLDGPPSVTDPAGTAATIAELLERADKAGKGIKLTVGDSSGFENGPLGRTSMDIMRDTGNYHYALKAGLEFEAKKGTPGAAESLAKIVAAEKKGVFFGSKDDKVSTPADLAAAEKAASRVVECIDYDKAGFVKVEPELGPNGLAAWGTREFQMAKPWVEADFRVHASRGLSNHLIANYTGSQKGLIGLHAIGLRPLDQGMDKRGANPIDVMNMITRTQAPGTLFSLRSGADPNLFDKMKSLGNKELEAQWASAEGKWGALRDRKEAYGAFKDEIDTLQKELNQQRESGVDSITLMENMRLGIRDALERADGKSPGFKQQFWDTAFESTKVAQRVGWELRGLVPKEIRDEEIGARIGLLSQLPYQSDLVVQTQPKIGEGGGPDAYQNVRDVGAVIVGTHESATDTLAWELAGKQGSMWKDNYPARFGIQFGVGPMHPDEIQRLDQ